MSETEMGQQVAQLHDGYMMMMMMNELGDDHGLAYCTIQTWPVTEKKL
jgi:hypothetical protein